jgi:hypothetical protein
LLASANREVSVKMEGWHKKLANGSRFATSGWAADVSVRPIPSLEGTLAGSALLI